MEQAIMAEEARQLGRRTEYEVVTRHLDLSSLSPLVYYSKSSPLFHLLSCCFYDFTPLPLVFMVIEHIQKE